MQAKFRFTPTPSGFLHRGNALNFFLTWWQAKLLGGKIVLRIDDHDEARVRKEYVDNVFETLNWLGLDWDEGPENTAEHFQQYSQTLKKEFYKKELKNVPGLFLCECSRKSLESFSGIYPGTCRHKNLTFDKNKELAVRLNTDSLEFEDNSFKDFILWRKDDLPSYQWVSLLEDREMKITHVIRGQDLVGSSGFQKALADFLNFPFPANIYHHSLIEKDGMKISKSNKASSLFEEFSKPEEFFTQVISPFLTQNWGFKGEIRGPKEALNFYQNLFN